MVTMLRGENLIEDGTRVGVAAQTMCPSHLFAKSPYQYSWLEILLDRNVEPVTLNEMTCNRVGKHDKVSAISTRECRDNRALE